MNERPTWLRFFDAGCGTGGNRGRGPLDLDEFEIMLVVRKTAPGRSEP